VRGPRRSRNAREQVHRYRPSASSRLAHTREAARFAIRPIVSRQGWQRPSTLSRGRSEARYCFLAVDGDFLSRRSAPMSDVRQILLARTLHRIAKTRYINRRICRGLRNCSTAARPKDGGYYRGNRGQPSASSATTITRRRISNRADGTRTRRTSQYLSRRQAQPFCRTAHIVEKATPHRRQAIRRRTTVLRYKGHAGTSLHTCQKRNPGGLPAAGASDQRARHTR